ncbi:UDP-galactose transporter [Savitreella phatthalungensis]
MSTVELAVCVGSIYTAYLSWAVLQERIATTPYDGQIFRSALVLNVAQSLAATVTGSLYLIYRQRPKSPSHFIRSVYGSRELARLFLFIAVTTSLASPFGYASLRYIDYPTQILGKSCKLLPVLFLGVLVYGKRYPPHKYLIVAMVTAGVAVFTLYAPSKHGKASKGPATGSSTYGLALLAVNLLLDGLTNSTQDQMFARHKSLTGPGMMVGLNGLVTVLTTAYMVCFTTEVSSTAAFVHRHPTVLRDIAAFAFTGATGQLAIFYTLERFGSLVLVTVTLTRKMVTMLLSVIWFNHPLSPAQYAGVALVFAGISIEALLKQAQSHSKAATPHIHGKKKA